MRRALLILGILALVFSAFVSVLRLLLPGSSLVEVFPIEPEALQPPAAMLGPANAPTPAPAIQTFPILLTLQQGVDGYDGCVDTFFEYYRLNDNFCRSPELYLRSNNKASVLLRYDLTRLPPIAFGLDRDASIQKATLSVFVIQGRKDTVIGLYRVRRPWDACSVTWNLPWTKPGGGDGAEDRDPDPSSELTTIKATGWLEWDVTELMRDWLRDPAANQGLMLKSFELRWPALLILFSADHPALGSRPKLTIQYEASVRTPTPILPTPTATMLPEPAATPTAPAEPAASPTTPPTPIPTATATPVPGSRVVELRWRPRMNVGNSYNITAVFRTSAQSEDAPVALPYELSVGGHLTAPSFSVTGLSETQQLLPDVNADLSWSWTVTPRLVGPQPLSLDLVFAWRTADVVSAEPGVWYKTKIVLVDRPVATWAQIDMARNTMALLGLGCLVGWYLLRRRA